MNLIKKTSLLLGLVLMFSCGQKVQKTEETGKRIAISDTIEADTSIANYIRPYKEHLNNTLDSTLAYNPQNLLKKGDGLNTALGNLMADVVMQQANPVFKQRTGKNIDMVLLNSGGIRSDLSKGNISRRSAYALMPFENEIVVTELSAKKMQELLEYLQKGKTAHPISGAQIKLDKDYNLLQATINGKKFDTDKTYFVATSDYLQQGGDHMDFFKEPLQLYHLDYKIRNALIDYFEKTDTIKAEADQRFVQLK